MAGKNSTLIRWFGFGLILMAHFLLASCQSNDAGSDSNSEATSPLPDSQTQTPETNVESSETTVSILPPSPFNTSGASSRQLSRGWNLVSLPIDRPYLLKQEVPSFLDSSIESLWKWDIQESRWQVYPKKDGFQSIEEINPNEGYWVRIEGTHLRRNS